MRKNRFEEKPLVGISRLELERGFTLIELLVIIFILGVLAATVIVAVGGSVNNAARAACNTDAKTVESAVELFHTNPTNTADTGNYPNASTGSPSGNTQLTAAASSNYGGPYLRSWPSSSHYTISLGTSGQVLVDGQNYDGATNPCASVS